VYGRQELAPAEGLALALDLAAVLAALEADDMAHGALSGATLLLPVEPDGCLIELTGLERLYAPGLAPPPALPPRFTGYGLASEHGAWQPEADRRAGGILLAELLGWGEGRVRAAAWEQSYFAPPDVGQPCEHYELLRHTLAQRSPSAAELLDAVWRAPTLVDCPALRDWLAVLPRPSAPPGQVSLEQDRGDRAAVFAALLARAEELLVAGERSEALTLLRQARGVLRADDPLVEALQARIRSLAG
jgi:hypothetical protein